MDRQGIISQMNIYLQQMQQDKLEHYQIKSITCLEGQVSQSGWVKASLEECNYKVFYSQHWFSWSLRKLKGSVREKITQVLTNKVKSSWLKAIEIYIHVNTLVKATVG